MNKKKKIKQIKEECYNLDYELVKWLNEHLKVYLKDADTIVDLDREKVTYKGREMTYRACLERLIYITGSLRIFAVWEMEATLAENMKNEMYDLLKAIHWKLWW